MIDLQKCIACGMVKFKTDVVESALVKNLSFIHYCCYSLYFFQNDICFIFVHKRNTLYFVLKQYEDVFIDFFNRIQNIYEKDCKYTYKIDNIYWASSQDDLENKINNLFLLE